MHARPGVSRASLPQGWESKALHRQYRNVHTDVEELEILCLVEKNKAGLYLVPWDEIITVIREIPGSPHLIPSGFL